jgi:hypothetical protein
MRLYRSLRWLLLALVFTLIPVSSQAGVFISVGFAPPVLPVYVQPPCPEPGLMWTPGYWAYGPDGYYWVPGTWVPAPYEGALWTPGFWGWSGGMYIFHNGYWGRHVGYYGGVNYGYGYGGIGFAGGMWRGHDFQYNTAVVHVNETVIHTTYIDRTVVERGTVARDSHVAFSGGPGGIQHQPTADERIAEHEQHAAPTRFQQQHIDTARADRTSYVKNNGGRPQNLAVAKPLGGGSHMQPGNNSMKGGGQNNPNTRSNVQPGNNTKLSGGQNNSVTRSNMQSGNNSMRGGAQNNANPKPNMQRNTQTQQFQQHNAQPQQQRPAVRSQSNQPAASHNAPKPQAATKDEHRR